MVANPFKIEKARVHQLEDIVPFTVVRLPETEYGVTEEPLIYYNFYYLRTGNSQETAVRDSRNEFKEYGFPEGRFDPNYISGVLIFEGENITIEPNESSLKGFNFWVAEGLIGDVYKKNFKCFPIVRTARDQTKKLYEKIYHCHKLKESEYDLADLLRDPEEPCSIKISPPFLDKDISSYRSASNGECPDRIRIMNYGYLGNSHSTFFEDPKTGEWYLLLNKDIFSEEQREKRRTLFKKELPRMNALSRVKGHCFQHSDKINTGRNNLFFDGSMQDVFKLLEERGVKFEE